MGSAREARDWYFKGRQVLSEKVAAHRIDFYTQLVRLLTRMIQNERKKRSLARIEETDEAE
ncbi:MAG TPA: hypothetical protein PLD59_12760 [Tepidisphaeraceae bacterium]|nr:hypothetical protein [Tepidisphaeraceae bacterium]